MKLNVTLRLKLSNTPGSLAGVLGKIAEQEGTLGAIDLVNVSRKFTIREVMVGIADREHLERVLSSLGDMPGVEVLQVTDRVFLKHQGGKIEVTAKRQLAGIEDLALIYTPGVARVAEAIAQNRDLAYQFTMKSNTIAIVTDGTAVLGLGDIGPEAGLPVMEGKAVLFKKFADINAVPLCLGVHSVEEIVATVVACAPAFGGINLEDIAAPKCFEIEDQLKKCLDIPVFHDDQHGTAIVALAGLTNALKVVGKELEKVKIVLSGAGAAGTAIAKLLLRSGARDVVVCDRGGVISSERKDLKGHKKWLADHTNFKNITGSLKEALVGADVFIGVSAPNLLEREDVLHMARSPIVFALANPEPEILPDKIYDLVGVVATGRSDYPNQINNVLAFPGVFKGALESCARLINEEMCLAASQALASVVNEDELSEEYIIPSIFQENLSQVVAQAVSKASRQTGACKISDENSVFFNL